MQILRDIPQGLQLVVLVLLGAYVVVSILGRVSPAFSGIWRDPEESRGWPHIFRYTVMPFIFLVVAISVVATHWRSDAKLFGDLTILDMLFGPGLILTAVALFITSSVLTKRIDISDASKPSAWIPLARPLPRSRVSQPASWCFETHFEFFITGPQSTTRHLGRALAWPNSRLEFAARAR